MMGEMRVLEARSDKGKVNQRKYLSNRLPISAIITWTLAALRLMNPPTLLALIVVCMMIVLDYNKG
jgi:hypothetical protein